MATVTGKTGNVCYEFGGFRLLPSERLLLREGKPVQLQPKVFDALVLLVESEGRLIEKDKLLKQLWQDTFVEEATLTRTISSLRKTLGEENKYIETVSKSGYRFIVAVRRVTQDTDSVSITQSEKSSTVRDEQTDKETKSETPNEQRTFFGLRINPRLLIALGLAVVLISAIAFVWLFYLRDTKKNSLIKSIAVLPFKFIGGQEDTRALEVGMADALIIKLSKAKQIVVRPTSAVFKYAGQNPDPAATGRELRVDVVLDGSIQKDGDRLRVTVQLISSTDGTPIWADKFDTRATDIFAVQDNISAQITQALEVQLTGAEQRQLAKRQTENIDAYQAYTNGRYFWNKRSPADLKKSLGFFEQAVKLDPNYALAHTGIADCYQLFAEYRLMPATEGFAKARNAATKALEIDETLAEAHTSLAYTLAFYDWNWLVAEREFKRAIELNPNYATAHHWYSEYLVVFGRFDEARTEILRAQELDPLSLIIRVDVAAYYYLIRQYDEAIALSKKILEIDPNLAFAYVFIWASYQQKGMDKEAIAAYLKIVALLWGRNETEVEELKRAYEKAGIKGFWRKRLEQMNRPSNQQIYLDWDYAVCYIWLGDKERAIESLQKAYAARNRWIINIKYDPTFDSIRSDPRFQELLRQMGLAD
jgi:TolB-like protein/DNA-binding winged helix-turn-helix (wHTH) protein